MASRARPSEPTRAVPSRIVITVVTPAVADGGWPVKRVVGEPVAVDATVFADGHDHVFCAVAHQAPGAVHVDARADDLDQPRSRPVARRVHPDPRAGDASVPRGGLDRRDRVRHHAVAAKLDDGQDVDVDLAIGAGLLDAAAAGAAPPDAAVLAAAADRSRAGDVTWLSTPGEVLDAARHSLRPTEAAESQPAVDVLVEATRALFNTWYELFPGSWSRTGSRTVHGTLADVEAQLGYVADMGFDVLYLPPIHPIGTSFRKGPDNTPIASASDPGSPWAIGDPSGGHTVVHPELGTEADLARLVRAADAEGIDVALDIAFQCSPDHPWVTEHPEWFRHRPDGSIQYAENPPKRYQDIYPLHFGTEAWESLWHALLDVFLHWARLGVSIFRVDNPHTKPFEFWAWVIGEVRRHCPDAVFLSEAFTRPAVMHRLAEVGFTMSYSYFPWRQSRDELIEYFTELSTGPSADHFRPSCWPNTPDILTEQLWGAPREAFALRYFLAATLSPSIGIYGPAFELGENRDARNGKEEYSHSEKYEIRSWDRDDPTSLREMIADVNGHRYAQLALQTLRTLRFHGSENESLLVYSKTPHRGPSVDPAQPHSASVLVVANLDPVWNQGGHVELDLGALGLDPDRPYRVHDLMSDRTFEWTGPRNYIELHPVDQPGHLFRVEQDPDA